MNELIALAKELGFTLSLMWKPIALPRLLR